MKRKILLVAAFLLVATFSQAAGPPCEVNCIQQARQAFFQCVGNGGDLATCAGVALSVYETCDSSCQ
jgi:hypothetical protein